MSTTDEQRPEPMAYMVTRKIRTNQDGRARYLHLNKERAEEDFDLWQEAGGADPVLIPLYAAPSEPAEPVDARDAMTEKMAPVQGWPQGIPWSLHLEAYAAYSKKWSPQPALIDLEGRGCRGGFGTGELDEFIPGWRDKVSEIGKLKAEVASLRAALARQAAAPAEGEK